MIERMPVWAEQLAVFDTETTGVDTARARIVSATIAVIGSTGEVNERYDWLINPGVEIPEAAARVHGITTAVARESGVDAAAGIEQVLAHLFDMLARGFALVAYNAPFDLSLLRAEAARHSLVWPGDPSPIIDPLVIDKQVDRYRRGKRTLEAVAAHYGVPLGLAHDAGEDAIAAGRLAQTLGRRYADVLPPDAVALHEAQVAWSAAQSASFQEYMRRVKDPTFVADGAWPIRELEPADNR